MVRRNILANTLGGTLTILLNLIIVPYQIHILGAEAFGLLSLLASLQVIFSVFDLGLSTTVIREVARDTSVGRETSRELSQTVATLYWLVALVLGASLFAGAGWIAQHWLNLRTLSSETAQLGMQILAFSVALRWPVGFYGGIITGLQALVAFNVLRTSAVVLKLGGGFAVLLITHDLTAFLVWTAISAIVEVALYALASFRLLPGLSPRPRISVCVIRHIWRFSLSMNLVSILALIFTQADRVLMSRLLPLEDVGYYSLAMNVVMSVSVIQGFVTSAVLPALATDYATCQDSEFAARYVKATQGLIYVLTLPTCVFVFFGRDLLRIWVSSDASGRSYLVLAVLAVGFLLNSSVSVSYTLSVATGNTRLPLLVNLVAAVIYVPGLYLLILRFGMMGAAAAWLLLNLYYLFTLLPLVQWQILNASVWAWLNQNLFPFLFVGAAVFSTAWGAAHLVRSQGGEVAVALVCVIAGLLYAILGFAALDATLRKDILVLSRRITTGLNSQKS